MALKKAARERVAVESDSADDQQGARKRISRLEKSTVQNRTDNENISSNIPNASEISKHTDQEAQPADRTPAQPILTPNQTDVTSPQPDIPQEAEVLAHGHPESGSSKLFITRSPSLDP